MGWRRISKLIGRLIEIIQSKLRKKMKKNEQPQENMGQICVKSRKRSRKNVWRNHGWKLLKFDENHYSIRLRGPVDPKYNKHREINNQMQHCKNAEDKENLASSKRKWLITYKGTLLPTYFSSETIQARRQWDDIFKVLEQQ